LRIHAVVPLKALARGKSRLAGTLAETDRARLIRAMLEQVVTAAASAPGIARVSVLTSDPALVPRGADHLADSGEELNAALARSVRSVREAGADVMLIVAADLPFVTAEEIGALAAASRGGGVVAAPDGKEQGTNALALPLTHPTARGPSTRFGPGSLAAHEAAARAAHLPWSVVRRPGLAYDLDEPAQLDTLPGARGGRYAFLAKARDASRDA
jgi:2-phospho-L-lactate guanylyltransferase